jgi:hypothetical protein
MAPTRTQTRSRTQPVPAADLSDNEDDIMTAPSAGGHAAFNGEDDDVDAMAVSFSAINIDGQYSWSPETTNFFEYSAMTFRLAPQHQQVVLRAMEAYARENFSEEQVSRWAAFLIQ